VLKRDGTRELFEKQKLLKSMVVACQKRAISLKDLEGIADWVERSVGSSEEKEITSARIGELVLDVLRHLDPVAYVRFASVYRAFSDPEDFALELKRLAQNAKFYKLPEDLSQDT
jgi:transcriptional repressor NrdR